MLSPTLRKDHTHNHVLKNSLFIHSVMSIVYIWSNENICFRVAIGFQAAPPKGGRVGSTLLWTKLFF